MTKILVTGAGGFIGSNIAGALATETIEYACTDLTRGALDKDIDLIEGDILNEGHINEVLKGVDIVVHTAVSDRRTSLTNPKKNVKINVDGTMNVLEAAVKNGAKKLIYLSASSVYGTPKYVPVNEDHPKDPTTIYGASKFAGEQLIRVYQKLHDIDFFIIRLTNVFGPGQHPYTKMLIPVVLNNIYEGKTIFIYGDGSQSRDFVYVGDVVRLIKDLINDTEKKNMEVNIGTGRQVSIMEIVNTCGEVMKIEPKIEYKEQEAGERLAFCADLTRCQKVFGYMPDTPLTGGLQTTVEWFRNHVWK